MHKALSRFWPQSKHEISKIMIKFLFNAYVGISSFQHQWQMDWLPLLLPAFLGHDHHPPLMFQIGSTIYLTPAIVTAPMYARFTESEFDWLHGAHHDRFPCNSSVFQSSSCPDPLLPDPTSQWSPQYCPFH
jgi:hypothetical protein